MNVCTVLDGPRVKPGVTNWFPGVTRKDCHTGLEPVSMSVCIVLDGPRVKPGVTN
jgi:hypothetical protein